MNVSLIVTTLLSVLGMADPSPKNHIGSRFHGGENAGEFEFPETLYYENDDYSFCTASIVSDYWGVTARHCYNRTLGEPTVYAGSSYFFNATRHTVEHVYVHNDIDIAVFKVREPFPIDGVKVRPVKLPQQGEEIEDGTKATAVGWGYISKNGDRKEYLQKLDIFTISNEACTEIFEKFGAEYNLTIPVIDYKYYMCLIPLNYSKGICQGDSGGPLFIDGTVMGIAKEFLTTNTSCSKMDRPMIYTKMSMFTDWITKLTTSD